jgi:putative salt-induced outer membrane protein
MKFVAILFLLPVIVFSKTQFGNESELSLIQTGGNSTIETYNAKTLSKWERDKRIYSFGGHYTLGYSEVVNEVTTENEKVESARNWDVMGRYEQKLSNKLNGFTSLQYEADIFAGFKQRENFDVGTKYIIGDSGTTKSFAEIGARYTIERRLVRDADNKDVFNFAKARLFYEIAYAKTKSLSYKFWVEYLPNFTEAEDYIITYEPSVAFVLSETFSLKTSYRAVYDNLPNVEGNKYTDYTFATSLLAKF